MARLPTPGGDNDNWGSLLNDYLQQSMAADGTLLTGANNAYTGSANTNIANASRPGLVQLAGDLTTPYTAPKVTGLQGRAVAATAPSDGQVLTWSATNSNWAPAAGGGGGGGTAPTRNVSSVSTATTAGTAANTDYLYLVSGTTTITLPTAVGNTNKYTVTNVGSSTVTVAASGGQGIVGSSTATLPVPGMSLDFLSTGSGWVIV